MSLHDFLENPWDTKNLHSVYESSFLHMRPAPEYANGEVVLASTYRYIGFGNSVVSESKVPELGRDLQRRIDKRQNAKNTNPIVDPEIWNQIISGVLRSPKQPNQAAKRFLQISPVVPDATIYSLSARLSSGSWNPGALVAKMLQFGEASRENAQILLNNVFHSLSVGEDDDIWARFLQREFECWRSKELIGIWSSPREMKIDESISAWHKSSVRTPSCRFTADLSKVLLLKNQLTRRQWISMLEAVLRVGTASHILWLCRANQECFNILKGVLAGKPCPDIKEIESLIGMERSFWRYGQYSNNPIRDHVAEFIKARVGINLILHQLSDILGTELDKCSLSNVDNIHRLTQLISSSEVKEKFDVSRFRHNYQDVIESDPRIVAVKKGTASNVKEFLQHVLAQRQTSEAGLDSYDQGYFLAKNGNSKSARWIVTLGPVSVLALVHACTHGSRAPKTINNFCQHLRQYGIEISAQEVSESSLGETLRHLGLVLDSPDAEGGMVLVNPFENFANQDEA